MISQPVPFRNIGSLKKLKVNIMQITISFLPVEFLSVVLGEEHKAIPGAK